MPLSNVNQYDSELINNGESGFSVITKGGAMLSNGNYSENTRTDIWVLEPDGGNRVAFRFHKGGMIKAFPHSNNDRYYCRFILE